ncbi:MAG: histidine phosphatase family protein [Caldilineaceae bacterium]
MKTLTIVRHAKAEDADGSHSDFERALTKRGQKDARHVSRVLTRCKAPIDWIVSSPALRTRMTAEILATEVGFAGAVQWADSAYLGEAESWLALLKEVPPEVEHVAVVGHNPGVAALVAGLTTGVPYHLNLHFPTAAVAHMEMEIFWWNQIRWGCGQLRLLFTPKILR